MRGRNPPRLQGISELQGSVTVKPTCANNYRSTVPPTSANTGPLHALFGTTGTDRGRLYQGRYRDTVGWDGAANPRRGRAQAALSMHNAYGYGLSPAASVTYGAERLGWPVVAVSGGITERQLQLLNDFRPHPSR